MRVSREMKMTGSLSLHVFKKWQVLPSLLLTVWRFGLPGFAETFAVNKWRFLNMPNLFRGLWRLLAARALRIPHFHGALFLTFIRADGHREFLGLASFRVVTDVGVAYIVDAFQNSVELENMKYHGLGTGTNNEAAADTALQTEITTEYATNSTRPTGTTTEGATANIYRTVATNTVDGTVAATEHGVFSASSAGVLLDRTKFSVVNLAIGDSLQSTYELTLTAGS